MFSLQVVDTDKFIEMSISARLLYYELGMRADDDGFVASPKKIIRSVGCSEDDLKLLIAKGFIIPFDSGVVVISHWKMNNYLQSDRYHQTIYQDEVKTLSLSSNVYSLDTTCIQAVSIGKDRIGKDDNSRASSTKYSSEISQIVACLNKNAGTRFKSDSKNTVRRITARLNEGYTVEDICRVIERKCADWRGTEYAQYLRPKTLFGSNFEGYINAVTAEHEKNTGGISQFLSAAP